MSITDEPQLKEHVDTLFLGGAPYANIMAPELRRYAEELSADKVGKVVLLRHRTGHAGRSMLLESCSPKGHSSRAGAFYAHMLNISGRLDEAKEFGRKFAE